MENRLTLCCDDSCGTFCYKIKLCLFVPVPGGITQSVFTGVLAIYTNRQAGVSMMAGFLACSLVNGKITFA